MGTLWMQMLMQRMCPSLRNLWNWQGDSPTAWHGSGAPVYDGSVGEHNSDTYMVYDNFSIHGVYKPTNITGAPHCN